ncbi:MAG TPA: LytR family transcriptional regulator, partial [Microbacterium sp.]|nr:LytR family transcriptional regulator [Microbacterium sp.]
MPRTTFPRDRFDDLPADVGRVGAHRAENPRMRGWVVFLWAALATIVLVALGIFGTLLVTGRVALFPTPEPTVAPLPIVTPVVDTTYEVLVLNATPEPGLATQMKDV